MPRPPVDRSLVVARHGSDVYARRLVRDRPGTDMIPQHGIDEVGGMFEQIRIDPGLGPKSFQEAAPFKLARGRTGPRVVAKVEIRPTAPPSSSQTRREASRPPSDSGSTSAGDQ